MGFKQLCVRNLPYRSLLCPMVFGAGVDSHEYLMKWFENKGLNSKVEILCVYFSCCEWLVQIEIQQISFLKKWPFLFIRNLFLRFDYTFNLFLVIVLPTLLCSLFLNESPSTDSVLFFFISQNYYEEMILIILPYRLTTVCFCMWLS